MTYVGEPFAFDLFVTYSHGDSNGTGHSKLKQWSQAFVDELETELKAHPDIASATIFLDEHHRPSQSIDPMAMLTDQLQRDIGRSAILTILMSPQYLRSTWCRDERNWWFDSQIRLGLPHDGRVAIARIWPTTETWPTPLIDGRNEPLLGFYFYDRANAELRPQPYEWPKPEPDSKGPFRDELLSLVGRLRLRLLEIRRRLDERRQREVAAAKLAAAGGQLLYLHGRADRSRRWDRASDVLRQNGFIVVPTEPDPVATDVGRIQEIKARRVEIMSGCDAVLLVGSDEGRAMDADLVVVGRQDRGSARALSNRQLPCAVLDGVGGTVATPQRKVMARGLDVEWIDATQEPWAPTVMDWLRNASTRE